MCILIKIDIAMGCYFLD